MLRRKFKRFTVFFIVLSTFYFVLSTLNSLNKAVPYDDEDDKFLVNTFKPAKAKPKNFDTAPVHVQKYHHDDIVYIEDDLKQKQLAFQVEAQVKAEKKLQAAKQAEKKPSMPIRQRQAFFENLFDIYMSHFPQISPLTPTGHQLDAVNMKDDHGPVLSEEYLSNHIQIDRSQFNELNIKHKSLVNHITQLECPDIYQGEGVVLIGDNTNLLLSVLAVETLRMHLKSDVAIEVMVPELTESSICESVFAPYNATCVPLLHNFSDKITKVWRFDREWYKSLAILNSNFKKVLLLDANTFPLEDPASIFKEQPLSKYGLVLWPDYWRRMTSPTYYKIIERTLDMFRTRLGENEFIKSQDTDGFFDKIPLHDRGGTIQDGTSASEIVLIDKQRHFHTLLLSLYYNINGKDFYYPLFTNFARNLGGGEKETLAAAANYLNAPYYQLKKACDVAGTWYEGRFHGIGMKQYNALKDYRNVILYKRNRGDFDSKLLDNKVAFVTINNPNLDPVRLLHSHNGLKDHTDGSRIRLLGEDLREVGFDLELSVFDIYKNLICESRIDFPGVGLDNRKAVCKFIILHLIFLKGSHKDIKIQ